MALLEAVNRDVELPARLLLWAGANPHRNVPAIRGLGRTKAWNESRCFSSAAAAITFGRHQLLDLLRIATMPDLVAHFPWAHDSWTLKKLSCHTTSFHLVGSHPHLHWSAAAAVWGLLMGRAGGVGIYCFGRDIRLRVTRTNSLFTARTAENAGGRHVPLASPMAEEREAL